MSELTLTETHRRLRAGVKEIRRTDPGIGNGLRIEVHTREIPMTASTPEEAFANCWPEGDDLRDFCDWQNAHREPQFRQDGAIVHIAFSTTGAWGELIDTRVVWLGTADHAPVVLDRRNGDRQGGTK